MTQPEYEQKKRECWEEFLSLGGAGDEVYKNHAFAYADKLIKKSKEVEEQ